MNTNKKKKDNPNNQEIVNDYNNLMGGFNVSPFFNNAPQLSHGKYVQLSAYEEKGFGAAVTTGNGSIQLTK